MKPQKTLAFPRFKSIHTHGDVYSAQVANRSRRINHLKHN